MRRRRRDGETAIEEDFLVEGSSERERLLDMAAGDPSARRRALLIDPSLAARSDDAGFGKDDVASVKDAVRMTRRLQRLQGPVDRSSFQRLAGLTAAMLLFLVLLIPADIDRSTEDAVSQGPWPIDGEFTITHPGIEAMNLPAARVYELAGEDFEVVLIVDESLEL